MKTSELIEIARYCSDGGCTKECPYYGTLDILTCEKKLVGDLGKRLEKAYHDLGKSECVTCKWAEECNQHDCIYDRNLRAEAIKEFADSFDDELAKLRDTYFERGLKDYSLVCEVIHDYLYRTLREMVGAE